MSQVTSKAIYLLSRPVTLAAIALLFLNDQLLRRTWPSWWTGKLGDFAWLFFTPFALAALLGWLVPARARRQDTVVGLLAVGLTASVFALVKSLPEFHHGMVGAAERLFGFRVGTVQDPTDLVALVSLAASWHMWKRRTSQPRTSPATGWIALSLVALLTIANTAAPDQGITCLALQDGGIVVSSSLYESYASSDGGLSWQASAREDDCYSQSDSRWIPGPNSVADPTDPDTLYRYSPGVAVERSTDGGQTWESEYGLHPNSEAQTSYYAKHYAGNPIATPGPFAALADPATGNIIFAMGIEGVLVRQADGNWIRVPVGDYRRFELNHVGAFLSLLSGEMWLGLAFAMLLIGTCGLRSSRTWSKVLLTIGWLLWGITVWFSPARVFGYFEALLPVLVIAGAIFIIPPAIDAAYRIGRSSMQAFGRIMIYASAGLIAFVLPYVLWALNALPTYSYAIVFGLILGVILLFLAFRSSTKSTGDQGAAKTETG